MKYLYGLSIQGIQSYIFSTNKLKEIIGASQLVKYLPEQIIESILKYKLDDESILLNAAGNFKYLFDSKEDCDLVFRHIPMEFYKQGGRITVSQAIVETENLSTNDIDKLEELIKVQRNKPAINPDLASMVILKNPKTGKAVVGKEKNDYLDSTQKKKRAAYTSISRIAPFKDTNHLTDDIENMTSDEFNNWIGIIHADGNGIGKKVIALSDRIKVQQKLEVKKTFKEFSLKLQEATESAVKKAFEEIISPIQDENLKIPFRPIIIGGDDITVITRGDLAIDFTKQFLIYFEQETKKHLSFLEEFSDGLTACAGIAFTKSHYPFHYGVNLAEDLCKHAKKEAKSISNKNTPSCLMFHRVHSSYVREWKKVVETELTTGKVKLANGPYYIRPIVEKFTIDELNRYAELLAEEEAPKSSIRQWLSELEKDETRAKDLMKRTQQMIGRKSRYWEQLNLDTTLNDIQKTHLFDALIIADLKYNRR